MIRSIIDIRRDLIDLVDSLDQISLGLAKKEALQIPEGKTEARALRRAKTRMKFARGDLLQARRYLILVKD